MVRFLAACMAVTLLWNGAGDSEAAYVSILQSNGLASGLGNGDGHLLNSLGVTVALPADELRARVLNHRGQVFIVTNTGSFRGGDRQWFEPGVTTASSAKVLPGDSVAARAGQLESDAAFLADSGCLGIGGGHFDDPFGVDRALSKNLFITDTFIHRTETLSSDDPFLASLGGLGIGAALSEPPRLVIDLSGSGSLSALLLNHKLLSGLSLLGIVALGTLAFALRQRRTVPHRGLRGPRGAAIYRSPTSTNPRGTMR